MGKGIEFIINFNALYYFDKHLQNILIHMPIEKM